MTISEGIGGMLTYQQGATQDGLLTEQDCPPGTFVDDPRGGPFNHCLAAPVPEPSTLALLAVALLAGYVCVEIFAPEWIVRRVFWSLIGAISTVVLACLVWLFVWS